MVAARDRHRGLQILPQGRHLRRREARRAQRQAAGAPRRAHDPRGGRQAGPLLRERRGGRDLRGRARAPARHADGGVQLARLVQLRALPALRHHRTGRQPRVGPRAGRDPRDEERLRAAAVLGLLHPVGRRRPDGHLRAHQERGAPLQVRLGHRHELQQAPRPAGETLGRRHLERPHELPRGPRSRGGRDEVGRHHAARREDGLPRHGPPRDRGLHRVEGPRGEEGTRPHRVGLRLGLQRRGLPHGLRPELEQQHPRHRRLHERGRGGRRVAHVHAHERPGLRHLQGARSLAQGQRERVVVRGSGPPVRQHHQRLAHLPEHGSHQREQPVLGVHVPRQHGLQSVVDQPEQALHGRGRLRRRGLPPRDPRVVHRAGDPRRLQRLPDEADRAEQPRLPPARPRLREPRHAAHAHGHPL